VDNRRVILFHPGSDVFGVGCISIDIFCDKNELPEHVRDGLESFGDDMRDCRYVKMFGDYDYFISLDLCHTYDVNIEIIKMLIELIKLGFKTEYIE
jgi:hypothetical protein